MNWDFVFVGLGVIWVICLVVEKVIKFRRRITELEESVERTFKLHLNRIINAFSYVEENDNKSMTVLPKLTDEELQKLFDGVYNFFDVVGMTDLMFRMYISQDDKNFILQAFKDVFELYSGDSSKWGERSGVSFFSSLWDSLLYRRGLVGQTVNKYDSLALVYLASYMLRPENADNSHIITSLQEIEQRFTDLTIELKDKYGIINTIDNHNLSFAQKRSHLKYYFYNPDHNVQWLNTDRLKGSLEIAILYQSFNLLIEDYFEEGKGVDVSVICGFWKDILNRQFPDSYIPLSAVEELERYIRNVVEELVNSSKAAETETSID